MTTTDKKGSVTARLLTDTHIDGKLYRANTVLTLPADRAKAYASALDSHADAIKAARAEGGKDVTHVVPKAEAAEKQAAKTAAEGEK